MPRGVSVRTCIDGDRIGRMCRRYERGRAAPIATAEHPYGRPFSKGKISVTNGFADPLLGATMRKSYLYFASAVCFLLGAYSDKANAGSLQLCGNEIVAAINPAATDVPANVADFVGQWGKGADAWDGVLCHVLIVTEAKADGTVAALYISGDVPQWRITKAVWPIIGKVEGEKMSFDIPGGAKATYLLDKSHDQLTGEYKGGRAVNSKVNLSRAK